MSNMMPDQRGLRETYANARRKKFFSTSNRVIWKSKSKYIA